MSCSVCHPEITKQLQTRLQEVQPLNVCPFCREQIQIGAIKCKHCGEFLIQQNTATLPAKDGAAAVMSFFIPGLGQMYHGRIGAGLLWFIGVFIGYVMLIVPGLVLHIVCISQAYSEHKV